MVDEWLEYYDYHTNSTQSVFIAMLRRFSSFINAQGGNHVDVEASIVLKNGLTMALTYHPNLGTGYISGHYFLSETDNAVIRDMFGQ